MESSIKKYEVSTKKSKLGPWKAYEIAVTF